MGKKALKSKIRINQCGKSVMEDCFHYKSENFATKLKNNFLHLLQAALIIRGFVVLFFLFLALQLPNIQLYYYSFPWVKYFFSKKSK
jgi:hypothetical protein